MVDAVLELALAALQHRGVREVRAVVALVGVLGDTRFVLHNGRNRAPFVLLKCRKGFLDVGPV